MHQASTTENLTLYIWDNLKSIMAKPELLYEVKILETDKNSVIYRGRYAANNSPRKICADSISSDSD